MAVVAVRPFSKRGPVLRSTGSGLAEGNYRAVAGHAVGPTAPEAVRKGVSILAQEEARGSSEQPAASTAWPNLG